MRLRLREDPREWQKFTAASLLALAILATVLWRRQILTVAHLRVIVGILCVTEVFCLIRPHWSRHFYRGGMTLLSAISHCVSLILLVVVFATVLTPLGWVLRLLGKDPLKLKRNSSATSYWQPSKGEGSFDREF
jgi:hypothetical protein